MQMAGPLTNKTVVIVVAHEFEDVELLYPVLRLSEEGAGIVVAPVYEGLHPRPHIEGKLVTGRFGHPVPIPVMAEGNRYRVGSVEELKADEIDCLLFPGGYSPDALRLHEPTLALVRACYRQGKVLAAICHGPWVLISAGIMEGKQATGYVAVRDDLINAGADFVDVPAVRDGNIITGRVPDDLPEFCREIITALSV
jgi:protease I